MCTQEQKNTSCPLWIWKNCLVMVLTKPAWGPAKCTEWISQCKQSNIFLFRHPREWNLEFLRSCRGPILLNGNLWPERTGAWIWDSLWFMTMSYVLGGPAGMTSVMGLYYMFELRPCYLLKCAKNYLNTNF